MTSLREDANRVRIALYLEAASFDEVLTALKDAEKTSVFLIEQVRKDLDKLESLAVKLEAELSSPNSALTRADVLHFAEGQRAKGMIIMQYNLMKKLGDDLNIAPNLKTIESIAYSMGFVLGQPIFFGRIQRS